MSGVIGYDLSTRDDDDDDEYVDTDSDSEEALKKMIEQLAIETSGYAVSTCRDILNQNLEGYTVSNRKVKQMLIAHFDEDICQKKNENHSQPKLHLLIYSPFYGFWQSFISIEVCRDCIPALASSCKKQLTGFFVCLLFFLKVKHIS